MKPYHHDNRATQSHCQTIRPSWEQGIVTEKGHGQEIAAIQITICQKPDTMSRSNALSGKDQCIRASQIDDVQFKVWINGSEECLNFPGVFLIHEQARGATVFDTTERE
ncbi:hypothetical protein JCM15831A_11410 [Asaia astilbis]